MPLKLPLKVNPEWPREIQDCESNSVSILMGKADSAEEDYKRAAEIVHCVNEHQRLVEQQARNKIDFQNLMESLRYAESLNKELVEVTENLFRNSTAQYGVSYREKVKALITRAKGGAA